MEEACRSGPDLQELLPFVVMHICSLEGILRL